MYLALGSTTLPPQGSLDEVLRSAADARFGGIELGLGDAITLDASEAECRIVASRARELMLHVSVRSARGPDLDSPAGCRAAMEVFESALWRCEWLGARLVVIGPTALSGGDD